MERKRNTIIKFSIFRPSGNDTCLIAGIPSFSDRKAINTFIQKEYPSVEQVGFLGTKPTSPVVIMVGGEFCGNAARSAAWSYLSGKPGELLLRVSGTDKKLIVGIAANGEAYAQIPIYEDPAKVMMENPSSFLVAIEGITHVVIFVNDKSWRDDKADIKSKARRELEKRGLLNLPAAGVMYVSSKPEGITIDPIVYVRDVNTLYYETACASGSCAVGLVLAKQNGMSVTSIPIMQPSGIPLSVSVEFDGKSFLYAQVQGLVEKISDGEVSSSRILQTDILPEKNIPLLEKQMVAYRDLINVRVLENNQTFVGLNGFGIANGYSPEMTAVEVTGPEIIVREEVAKRLVMAQRLLQKKYPDYRLFVRYGYRSLKVQTEKFLRQLQIEIQSGRFFPDPMKLYEEVHRFIAVPTVAGHPTGGAVDILIMDKRTDEFIDFGGEYSNFTSKNCYTFFPDINNEAKENRLILRHVMTEAGFAPFDGEWWHFSYGDREWAYYYGEDNALYEQKFLKKGGEVYE